MTSQPAEGLNWAVVGTGSISQLIANDLALTPGARRYAVVSRDQAKASAFAHDRGFSVAYADLHHMLADSNVHIVYIGTAISAASLVGSWMNDAGFWVFSKIGGVTEVETLRSWTPLSAIVGITLNLIVVYGLVVPTGEDD